MHPSCWLSDGSNHQGSHLKSNLQYDIWRMVYPDLIALTSLAAKPKEKEGKKKGKKKQKGVRLYCG
jgi:hypothetical protein